MIYVNKIGNEITFKIKIRYYLEILKPETIKFLGSTKSNITKNENGENVPHLEVARFINNNYQQDSKFLYTFVPNKSFGLLLNMSSKHFIF